MRYSPLFNDMLRAGSTVFNPVSSPMKTRLFPFLYQPQKSKLKEMFYGFHSEEV